jgi:hypothetical protein
MKSFGMSLFYICVITLSLIISPCFSLGLRAEDNTANVHNKHHKSPPKFTVHNTCKNGDCADAQNTISFGNSNTNNSGGLPAFPRTATLVNPTITFHSQSTVNAVKHTKAQVGWRHETHKVTSLNRISGKLSRKTINKKVPILGAVQTITPLKAHHTKKYDLSNHTFGATKTTLSE